jgi:nucleoside-diphosphate-sugar epimerase
MSRTKTDQETAVLPSEAVTAPGEAGIEHVLVIGGAGYVGSVLVRDLLQRFQRVTVMDAFLFGEESIRDVGNDPRVDVVRGDLRDIEAIVRASRDADAVVHLGGLVGDPACALDHQLTKEVNLEATRTIARAARGLGVQRFVFASSCSVYGSSDELLDEESALDPVSLYAISKMESERILLEFEREDFAPVILRFGTFYGLSPRPRFDLIVNMLAAKAATEGEITVIGGDQWRPFVHVADGVDAIVRCLTAPVDDVTGQIFNVGSDEQNYTIRQVADLIAQEIIGTRIHVKDEQDPANYRVSFEKIRRTLGFEPRHRLLDSIVEIRTEVERGTFADYLDERYSNVKAMAAAVDRTEGAADGNGALAPLALEEVVDVPAGPVSSNGNGHP